MSPAYTRLQITLHWIVVALIAFNFLSGDAMSEGYRRAVDAGTVGGPTPHAISGVLVLLLMVARMVIKARRGGAPTPLPGTTPAMHRAANIGHLAIYALVLLTALSGMLAWGADIRPFAEVHEVLKTILMVTLIGHVAFALYHQFVKKDGSLMRMVRPD